MISAAPSMARRCAILVRMYMLPAHEILHGLVFLKHAALHGMRGGKAVERRDDGQQHIRVLGHLEGDDGVVIGFLGGLGEEHDPTSVTHAHDVGVVAVDVDRSRDRTVGVRHDDGQAHAGSDREFLPHVGQALRARGGCHARASCGRADAGGHRGVLGLDGDELGVHLAVGDELRVGLDDRGLRGNRVSSHDVGIDLAHGVGYHLVTGSGESFFTHRKPPSPRTR